MKAVNSVGAVDIDQILETATPGSWMHQKIMSSTPVLASEIFTQHLVIKSRRCAYMESKVPIILSLGSHYAAKKL